MFKLVVLLAVAGFVAAAPRPHILHAGLPLDTVEIHASPIFASAPLIETIPTAVSHQSRIDIHHGGALITPIAHYAALPALHAW